MIVCKFTLLLNLWWNQNTLALDQTSVVNQVMCMSSMVLAHKLIPG